MKNKMNFCLCFVFICALFASLFTAPVSASETDDLSYDFSSYSQLSSGSLDIPCVIRGKSSDLTVIQDKYSSSIFVIYSPSIVKIASPDQQYTISNTGKQDISISLIIFLRESTVSLLSQFNSKDDKLFLETYLKGATEVYFGNRSTNMFYYLTTDHTFESGINSRYSERVLQIRPGESVTFTLPNAVEGQFYRIYVEPDNPAFKYFDVLISDKIESPAIVSTFTDVAEDAYYAKSVAWAVENAITTGTTETTFSPHDTCTNAQILTLLWRAKGQPNVSAENPFTDVSESDYYYHAALWAYENGLVEGGLFNGSAPCTRAMTVTCLWKLAGMPDASGAGFTDVDSGAQYAKAVAWAVNEGITTGTSSTTFSPDLTCTRAQIVTFLCRALAN